MLYLDSWVQQFMSCNRIIIHSISLGLYKTKGLLSCLELIAIILYSRISVPVTNLGGKCWWSVWRSSKLGKFYNARSIVRTVIYYFNFDLQSFSRFELLNIEIPIIFVKYSKSSIQKYSLQFLFRSCRGLK